MRRMTGVAAAGAVVLAAVAAAGFWQARQARVAAPPLTGAAAEMAILDVPEPAPDISFSDAAGNSVSLADFRGRVVLLNLWATWCAPCVRELPSLDRLQAQLGGPGFQVVALSIDREGMAKVGPFLAEVGVAALAPHLDPSGRSPIAFGARGLPSTYLIDREGRIVGRQETDAEWDDPGAVALIRYYVEGEGEALR
jgi:thiol-disulfide isomerase/thioredoxin